MFPLLKISLILLLSCISITAQNFFPVGVNNRYQTYCHKFGYVAHAGSYDHYGWGNFNIYKDSLHNGELYYQFFGNHGPFNELYLLRFDEQQQKLFIKRPNDDTVRIAADMTLPADTVFVSYIAGNPYPFISLGTGETVVFGDTVMTFGMYYENFSVTDNIFKYIFAENYGVIFYGEMHSAFPSWYASFDTISSAVINEKVYNPIVINIDSLYPIKDRPFNSIPYKLYSKYSTNQFIGLEKFYVDVIQIRGDSVFKTYSFPFDVNNQAYLNISPRSVGDTLKIKAYIKEKSIFHDEDVWPDSGYAIVVLLPSVTDIDEEIKNSSFSLSQNFPNPFNPVTTISYDISVDSKVSLIVYDIIGREVSTLVNEEKKAGSYQIQFNASFLANGVYLYKLQAGDFIKVQKMTLIK